MKHLSLFALIAAVSGGSAQAISLVQVNMGPDTSVAIVRTLAASAAALGADAAGYLPNEDVSKANCQVRVKRPNRTESEMSDPANRIRCTYEQRTAAKVVTLSLGTSKVDSFGDDRSKKDFVFRGPLCTQLYMALAKNYDAYGMENKTLDAWEYTANTGDVLSNMEILTRPRPSLEDIPYIALMATSDKDPAGVVRKRCAVLGDLVDLDSAKSKAAPVAE